MVRGGLAAATVGFVWMQWPAPDAGATFDPVVAHPAYTQRPRPRILVDEGHLNTHRAGGRYRPLAQLLQRDGFSVLSADGRVTAASLRTGDLFVTVNPLGYRGLLQHLANVAGFERTVRFDANAFADAEIDALFQWVNDGGRALIVADHAPAGLAARRLAARFGVEMTNLWTEDRGATTIAFTRENGGLADHPLTNGRGPAERVEAVATFTGQSLKPPPAGATILKLSADARGYTYRRSRESEGRPAAGLAQCVALTVGRGRVVVMGEASALVSAQGDNRQFALNIMHWLMGLIP